MQRGPGAGQPGNVQGAAEQYRKALLFMPDEPDYPDLVVVALVELRELDEAESHLQELLQGDPTDGLVNVMLARVAERRRETGPGDRIFSARSIRTLASRKIIFKTCGAWELVSLRKRRTGGTELVGELLQLYANTGADAKEKSKIGFLLLQVRSVSDATTCSTTDPRFSPLRARHSMDRAKPTSIRATMRRRAAISASDTP